MLDSFDPYLHDRLADGERNATVLQAEIAERGDTGGYTTLARYLRPRRPVDPTALAALSPLPGRPAVRRVAGAERGVLFQGAFETDTDRGVQAVPEQVRGRRGGGRRPHPAQDDARDEVFTDPDPKPQVQAVGSW